MLWKMDDPNPSPGTQILTILLFHLSVPMVFFYFSFLWGLIHICMVFKICLALYKHCNDLMLFFLKVLLFSTNYTKCGRLWCLILVI
jgi:hypothetical protein